MFKKLKEKLSVPTPKYSVVGNQKYAEAMREKEARVQEQEFINSQSALFPPTMGTLSRSYHYQDIEIVLDWRYGGHYGKTCRDIGVKRGDRLDLIVTPIAEESFSDPDNIAVYWNGVNLGRMKNNRLREMVHKWQKAQLPILAAVSNTGDWSKLYLELAFYGKPAPKSKK